MRCSIFALFVSLGFLACLSGCGGAPKTFPVNGRVTVNGKPLQAGDIFFHPEYSTDGRGASSGRVSSGSYSFTASLGKYKVTISPPPDAPRSQGFHNKFGDVRQTTLTVEVVESPAAGAYDLKLTNK